MAYTVSSSPYGLNAAVPNPPYSGTFIPEIWSGKLIEKFYASTVLAAISNTDYEGEIKNHGDKINIRTKPTITIRDYQAEQELTVDRPAAPVVTMLIDKGNYFNVAIDDVMEVQSDINMMNLWSDDAGEQMKLVVDRAVLKDMSGKAAAGNRGLTAGAISGTINLGVTGTPLNLVARNPGSGEVDILDALVRMGQALDEQNIPETGRWAIIPSWVASYIKQSDLRNAGLSGDNQSMLRNGRLGEVDRFTLYTSNLLPSNATDNVAYAAGEWPLFAGTSHGLSFAAQISKVETIRSEKSFSTLLRGLQVYGWKVLDNTAIVQAIVTP